MVDLFADMELISPLVVALGVLFILCNLIICCRENIIFCLHSEGSLSTSEDGDTSSSRLNCSLTGETMSTRSFKLLMNLTAGLCIISTLMMLVLLCGFQTTSANPHTPVLSAYTGVCKQLGLLWGIKHLVYNASIDFLRLGALFLYVCQT